MKRLLFFFFALAFSVLMFGSSRISAQSPRGTAIFPDEYSELDDTSRTGLRLNDKFTKPILEKAKKDYNAALDLIAEGDTAKAAFMFERAIARLNPLAGYPNIDDNIEYIDLFQMIVDDYELFIRSTEFIDENTPFYIIQDLYFEDTDSLTYTTAEEEHFEPESIAFEPGYIPPPDSMVIELTDNEFVRRNIEFYTNTKIGRQKINKTMERSSKWFPMFKRIAAEEGVPEEVIYISIIESALLPTAVSRKRAVGMWQFVYSTGRMYDLNNPRNMFLDERRDPEKATRAAMRHLLDLYIVFGDWHLAFAAYNCGQGCVSRAIKRAGLKKEEADFWKINKKIPTETRYYVPNYIAIVKLFSEPEKYGISIDSLDFQEEYKYDIFELDTAVSLYGLAKCADMTESELRDLNPELIKSCTPPEGYELKIPVGTKDIFALKFRDLPEEDKKPFHVHIVGRRESIATLSKKYEVSRNEIAILNGFESSNTRIGMGDSVLIPVDPRLWTTAGEYDKDKNLTAPKDSTKEYVTHIVDYGETLYGIAKKYNINPSVLQELNEFNPDEDVLKPGDELIIAQRNLTPEEISAREERQKKEDEKNNPKIIKHKVQSGESLHEIANNYCISIEEIQDLNHLENFKIYTGQTLKILTTKEYKQKKAEIKRRNTPRKNSHGDIIHTVRRGETLIGIALKYNTTAAAIQRLNPNKVDGEKIIAGSTLQITGPVRTAKKKEREPEELPAGNYYVVKKGESFYSIAKKYGLTADQLQTLNPGVRPERIQIGQKIRIK